MSDQDHVQKLKEVLNLMQAEKSALEHSLSSAIQENIKIKTKLVLLEKKLELLNKEKSPSEKKLESKKEENSIDNKEEAPQDLPDAA